MVYKRIHTARMKVGENRDKYRFICIGGKECNSPTRRVLCTESYLVSFPDTDRFKENMESGYLGGELSESEKFTAVIT